VKASNTPVDDGTGSGTTVRACVKGGKKGADTLVDDGTGSGTLVRACVKGGKKGGNTLVRGRWHRQRNHGEGVRESWQERWQHASGRWHRQRDHGEGVRERWQDGFQHARELHASPPCNAARRTRGSDKCNPCAVAVMYAVFGT
jgi:hypothetical protein